MRHAEHFFVALEVWRDQTETVPLRESQPVTDSAGVRHWFVLARTTVARRRRRAIPTVPTVPLRRASATAA